MSDLPERNDISKREFARGRRLKTAAVAAPVVLAGIPAAVFTTLFLLFGNEPAVGSDVPVFWAHFNRDRVCFGARTFRILCLQTLQLVARNA